MTINKNDFLIEIGTEDLPAKGLEKLSFDLENHVLDALEKANIPHGESKRYVTPRRLAVWIKDLADTQPNSMIERKGPATTAPEKAQEGFAKSCGVTLAQLTVQDNYLIHRYEQVGKKISDFMPSFIEDALNKIPVGKTMRWGNHTESFTRPIRWILMIHGDTVVPGSIFDIPTGNITYGHRFHHPEPITIKNPTDYEQTLEAHKVIADFEKRRHLIGKQSPLVDEITGLVEWPVILEGTFEERFSNLPKEVLSTVMAHHQKCFPGKNPNTFAIISNIESVQPKTVIEGNERVMRARLSDAEFFYSADCKHTLESRLDDLKTITFQAKLGSLYDKSVRVKNLAGILAADTHINADKNLAARAGLLCKTDLTSGMVGEFPELQGIMGSYYALHDKEDNAVADALREHYLPQPTSALGCIVALADRLDSIVGIFGINQQPTGDKDPFALRRAAVGVINILLSKKWNLDLTSFLEKSVENYGICLINKNVIPEVLKFILERMRAMYISQGINNTIVLAVETRGFTNPFDFNQRIDAVEKFSHMPQASALAAANKRVSNLLIKEGQHGVDGNPDPALFELPAEHALWDAITNADQRCNKKDYNDILDILAELQNPVDQFFNDVMVMVDEKSLRVNRLRLLNYLRNLFLQVADISLLQE